MGCAGFSNHLLLCGPVWLIVYGLTWCVSAGVVTPSDKCTGKFKKSLKGQPDGGDIMWIVHVHVHTGSVAPLFDAERYKSNRT